MPADKVLSPSILAALGLAVGASCGPCLDYSVKDTGTEGDADADSDADADTDTDTDTGTYGACLNYAPPTGDTGTPDTGTYGPCLDYPPPDTSADTGADTGSTATVGSRAASFLRLAAEGVLPPDVVERLRSR
jgi:hypothetical protein